MPVIPHGIPAYRIRPPLTSHDKGEPSESILTDAQRIFELMEDERHLTAHALLQNVQERIQDWKKQEQNQSSSYGPLHEQQRREQPHHDSPNRRRRKSPLSLPSLGGLGNLNPRLLTSKFSSSLHYGGTSSSSKGGGGGTTSSEEDDDDDDTSLMSTNHDDDQQQQYTEAQELLQSQHEQITKLENRTRLFQRARDSLNGTQDEWTLGSTHFGITTYYHREKDGSLSIKLEGELKDCPLFEQVCVMREVDLHYKWAPFWCSSMMVAELDKLDIVGWFLVGLQKFGLARDGCFRVVGCDNTLEDGSILLAGHGIQDVPTTPPAPTPQKSPTSSVPSSVVNSPDNSEKFSSSDDDSENADDSINYDFLAHDPLLEQLPIPPVPTRRGAGRMTIRRFDAKITVTSPTSASTHVIINIDPNIAIVPNVLLEFLMKHLAGVMLFKLQGAAKRAVKNPIHNEHAKRMRQEEEFYKQWLLPKFQAICIDRGWEMPPVRAFELTQQQLRKENNNTQKNKSPQASCASSNDQDLPQRQQQQQQQQKPQHNPTATARRAVTFHEENSSDENDDFHADLPPPGPRSRFMRRRAQTDQHFDMSMRQTCSFDDDRRRHRHHDDEFISDGVSELSSRSGFSTPWQAVQTFHKNGGPLGHFIRQQEARKQEEIEQARQKVSNLLKPKELDAQQLKRLEELKLAKARRLVEEQCDLSSASFVLPPLQRADSAPQLDTQFEAEPTRTNTRARAATAITESRPFGLESETITISTRTNSSQAPPSQNQQQKQQQPQAYSMIHMPNQQKRRRRRPFLKFVTDRLYRHGRAKRCFVVSLMVVLLFVSLHPRVLFMRVKLPALFHTFNNNENVEHWWDSATSLCMDVATSFYLCICAILHFFLCDISLVYAFDSLELGSKTGRQVRKFYIDNVRTPVAMTSFGIVFVGITKALLRLGVRATLWSLVVAYEAARGWSSRLFLAAEEQFDKLAPAGVRDYWNIIVTMWSRSWLLAQGTMRVCVAAPFDFVVQHAIRSNRLGRSVEALVSQVCHLSSLVINEVSASAREAVLTFEGEIPVKPWRMEAFYTARTLLSYTAVFLVTTLILFNLSAKRRRAANVIRFDSQAASSATTDESHSSEENVFEESAPPALTTISPKAEGIGYDQHDESKSNGVVRLESSLQSFGVSQHDAAVNVETPLSSQTKDSDSSGKKGHGVLRFRKKRPESSAIPSNFTAHFGAKINRNSTL